MRPLTDDMTGPLKAKEFMRKLAKPIPEMNKDEVIRELCERLGIQWHHITTDVDIVDGWAWSSCACGDRWFDHAIDKTHRNPDFYSDPVKLLQEMIKRKDFWKLSKFLWDILFSDIGGIPSTDYIVDYFIEKAVPNCYIIDVDGLFAKGALDYLRKADGDN